MFGEYNQERFTNMQFLSQFYNLELFTFDTSENVTEIYCEGIRVYGVILSVCIALQDDRCVEYVFN